MSKALQQSDDSQFVCTELNHNRRHYSALRFAIFSVYFAVAGGLSAIAFGIVEVKASDRSNIAFWAKLGGLLVTGVFYWLEVLCTLTIRHYSMLAEELPQRYKEISKRTRYRRLNAAYATWTMYILIILFWIRALTWAV